MAEKEKKKAKEKSYKKVKLIQWHYENGDIGAVLKEGKGYFHAVILTSDSAVNKEIEWLSGQEEKGKLKIKGKKFYELPIGISTYIDQYEKDDSWGMDQRRAALEEFKKMIRANRDQDAQKLITKLTAMVLSSYWIRQAMEIPDIHDTYPVDGLDASLYACITKCENPDSLPALKKICRSIMISTTVRRDKRFRIEAPVFLPNHGERELLSAAWLKLKGDEDEHIWPAPYRDMAVLWDRGFLKKSKELVGFMDRNPWCTCVIFGKKISHPKRIGIEIEGKDILDKLKVDWDDVQVKKLVSAYAAYMNKYFANDEQEFLRVWGIAGEHLKCYLANLPKAQREERKSECFRDRILLSVYISFMEFIYQTCQIPLSEAIELRKELLTSLLPGCYPKNVTQDEEDVQKSSLEQFEEVLQTLITMENLEHFYAIKKGQKIWLEETEDGTDIWGYVREFEDKESGTFIPCVVLIRKDLIRLAHNTPSFSKVLTRIRKERPPYLHPTPNVSVKRSKDERGEPTTVYRLMIEDEALPISVECKQALLQMLKE